MVYIMVYNIIYNMVYGRNNADLLCTTALWAISCPRSTKFARQNGTIDLQTKWFGKGVDLCTSTAWMGLRLLLQLCVMSTTALRASVPSQNWTILLNHMRWDRSVMWREQYMLHERNILMQQELWRSGTRQGWVHYYMAVVYAMFYTMLYTMVYIYLTIYHSI